MTHSDLLTGAVLLAGVLIAGYVAFWLLAGLFFLGVGALHVWKLTLILAVLGGFAAGLPGALIGAGIGGAAGLLSILLRDEEPRWLS